MSALLEGLERLAKEPPFRIATRALLKLLPVSAEVRQRWELSRRPAYLLGVCAAAQQALRQHVDEIAVVEFGVAGGDGLLTLERESAAVSRETGVRIRVYGFDMGAAGLPSFIGDHRDASEYWRPGDFPMNEAALRSRLSEHTNLVLGNVQRTVPAFASEWQPPPIGFVAFDLDLYSSTRDALALFHQPGVRLLAHVPLYFDDVDHFFSHRFAGERLAIDEFNTTGNRVRIDHWHGLRDGRPFPERPFLDKMYMAHDLTVAAQIKVERDVRVLPMRA
ncbi:MAG TPA: hypothetical protein VF483_01885 [Gemmatimonadaceae bacterium]